MSEHYAYVACNCFTDGLTTDPPVPRPQLDLDRFGNVKRKVDRSPDDSPDDLWDWRWEHACAHQDMQLVEEIYYLTRREGMDPALAVALDSEPFEALRGMWDRLPSGDAAVLFTPSEAAHGLDLVLRLIEAKDRSEPDGPLRLLRRLFEASVETSNPVVSYYDGHSLGF